CARRGLGQGFVYW
nr:immunoglobulin heavy chain junction region [Mus musculus]